MDLQLSDKTALVTGASKGIGKAIARALAQEGCSVAIAARTTDELEATASELADETGQTVVAVTMDVADDASVAAGVAEATAALGRIDILVNSAAQPQGQSRPPKLADITDDLFWDDVNVKVMGAIRTSREVAPQMVDRGWGRIINVSGLGARIPMSAIGSTRNVGLAAVTKNLADELGPHGVNVTVVHPGITRTEATPRTMATRAEAAGVSVEEVAATFANSNSIKKLIDAEEVAWVVAFLASPRAISINGDAIACGGGQPGAIHY